MNEGRIRIPSLPHQEQQLHQSLHPFYYFSDSLYPPPVILPSSIPRELVALCAALSILNRYFLTRSCPVRNCVSYFDLFFRTYSPPTSLCCGSKFLLGNTPRPVPPTSLPIFYSCVLSSALGSTGTIPSQKLRSSSIVMNKFKRMIYYIIAN